MRQNYSAPVIPSRALSRISRIDRGEPGEEKQVDYSHLDIIAEVERIIERRLLRHTRTSGKYHCACPFPDCTSTQDAFTVWDRPVLEERGDGRREVHFWCGRCGRTGSLISLIRQYREATTAGTKVSWADAARELRIDPQTWHAIADHAQTAEPGTLSHNVAAEKRRQQREQQRAKEQDELVRLDTLYHRARAWLAAGQIILKSGHQIPLEHARAYVQARGYTLEQAVSLGMAYVPTVQEMPDMAQLVGRSWRGRMLFPLSGPHGIHGYAGRTLWRWTPGMTTEQHKHLLDAWNEQNPHMRVARHYKTPRPAYYGYQDACHASRLVIVEGEFDAASVRLALSGRDDLAVCAFGKNLQERLIPLNVLHIVIGFDMDRAGREAIEHLTGTLRARGIEVSRAVPPVGKDWNDCHILAGQEVIRTEIIRAWLPSSVYMPLLEQRTMTVQEFRPRPVEPSDYDRGDICLVCGKWIETMKDVFYVCEDEASSCYGDLFCASCWMGQQEQTSMRNDPALENFDRREKAGMDILTRERSLR